jgi:hypothetical protein
MAALRKHACPPLAAVFTVPSFAAFPSVSATISGGAKRRSQDEMNLQPAKRAEFASALAALFYDIAVAHSLPVA